ncbi:MAG: NAD(P)-binding protein, partial [Planctomycetota bacterium]|nr:NAD(P)-binding protein [Planctomycetota bacterium]
MRYDTVIIGAGLSGLAAGIRLAYFDRSVCVLERHTTVGGLNSFYRLRDRNHDVGLHAVTNYAAPGTLTGPLSKLLRQLRLRWEDFALVPQTQSSIVFPDCTLRFTNDFEYFEQQVVERFPAEKDNFARLVQRIAEYDPMALDQPEISTREVLGEELDDPLLVEMLLCPTMFYSSATPDDLEWPQFVIMFRSIFHEGFGRPLEGVRLIIKK